MSVDLLQDPPNLDTALLPLCSAQAFQSVGRSTHPPRIGLLYGSEPAGLEESKRKFGWSRPDFDDSAGQ